MFASPWNDRTTAGECTKKMYRKQYIRNLDPGILGFSWFFLVFPSEARKFQDPGWKLSLLITLTHRTSGITQLAYGMRLRCVKTVHVHVYRHTYTCIWARVYEHKWFHIMLYMFPYTCLYTLGCLVITWRYEVQLWRYQDRKCCLPELFETYQDHELCWNNLTLKACWPIYIHAYTLCAHVYVYVYICIIHIYIYIYSYAYVRICLLCMYEYVCMCIRLFRKTRGLFWW